LGGDANNLSDRLRWLRQTRFGDRGRSAIARLAGISGTAWAAYEDRGTEPSAGVIARLWGAIPELNMRWLLLGEGEPFGQNTAPGACAADRTDDELLGELQRRTERYLGQAQEMARAVRALSLALSVAKKNRPPVAGGQ
jgi:hypothetical protein